MTNPIGVCRATALAVCPALQPGVLPRSMFRLSIFSHGALLSSATDRRPA
ncbi:MAG TPA: hypothetical protein VGC09_06265 [Rhodopila sp.]